MAAVNSRVLACNYAISDATSKFGVAATPSSVALPSVSAGSKSVRAQQQTRVPELKLKEEGRGRGRGSEGRRAALFGLAAVLFAASTSSAANASIIDEYLEKSKTNKALNDKKRLATSGANFARAYTVEFGSCKFPENFTGCQDLAKQKKVPFISDDLKLECEGKDKYKCGSNVFWKW